MAIAGFILGIISIICGGLGIGFGWPVFAGLASGIVGIVFCSIRLKKSKLAIAGFVCSIVGTVFNIVLFAYILLVIRIIVAIFR